ncbi:MAG: phenylalanine--tRNA ligase subunit beta [Candidatus Altiarchaeota archaeon]|nr:phenylalanine--tRNA ligase subunit beta [Candidatus Altiarchaeota archaeon]
MIIEVSFEELSKLLKTKVTLEQVIKGLDMLGTPIDDVDGDLLRVEVFPNRIDMLSPEGLSRSLDGFLGGETGYPLWKMKPSKVEASVSSTIRPFVSFSTVTGASLSETAVQNLMQMQEKLHTTVGRDRKKFSIGVYDLDLIKPPIVFKELPLKEIQFRPLDENSDMTGKEILESTEKGKKYAHLVGNMAPVLMDDSKRILSMPPIINADFCKVTSNTTNFLIDSTGTSEGTNQMVAIVATALARRGGSIGVVMPGPTYLPRRIKVDLKYLKKITGLEINKGTLGRLLEKMRLGYDGDILVPPYRTDIFGPIDIAEDLAIAYGYEKFEGELSPTYSTGKPLKSNELNNELRKLLVGFGFLELKTFMLTSPKILKLSGGYKLKVNNSKSREYSALRQSILPGMFDVLAFNKNADYPQRVFEVGSVFTPDEEPRIAGMIAHKNSSFSEIKSVVDRLVSTISKSPEWVSGEHPFFMEGRVAVSDIGVYGEVKLDISEKLGVPISAFEINPRKLSLQERIL